MSKKYFKGVCIKLNKLIEKRHAILLKCLDSGELVVDPKIFEE